MNFPHKVDDKRWLATTRDLMRSLQRQSGYQRYTLGSAGANHQSPFLSALHALVYRWYDGDMAADELKSASAQQVTAGVVAGMIPATNLWDDSQPVTPFAAPPLLAFAGVAVYHLTGDYNLIERLYPRVTAAHDWFDRRRVQDGLAIPAHPAETLRGTWEPIDASEAYAPTWRDIVELNSLRAADLDAVAHLAKDMGNKAEAAAWEERARAVRHTVAEAARDDPLNPLLLFGQIATPEQATEIAGRLQAADRLWAPEGETFVSLLYNWLIYVGLRTYELRPAANRLAELALAQVEQAGDYAIFDAASGAGVGRAGQSLTVLAVDMLFRERQSIAPGAHCI